ncbi:hypothetical protein CPLU01_08572 [Colletotrichum plurivorum]|uniref:Uncharacterized protein n=1 Tax=Colletotrichum plurivorum TaxID=2175906 RepID=A0A8H6KAV5_9PEZI|nr:hypothetical protein CPLU01_08572 [Colletotrichum plurivorum]
MELKDLSQQKLLATATQTQVTARHTCHQSVEKPLWLRLVKEWHLLLLYLIFSVAFAFSMWRGLDGQSFAVSGNARLSGSSFRLSQPDVVTIISACLVVGRAVAASWQALAAWRCLFILFEKAGLSLADADVVGSMKLPPWSVVRPPSSSRPSGSAARLIAVLSLLLAWPAQLASPLASGSISWVPIKAYNIRPEKTIALGFVLWGSPEWNFLGGPNIREAIVRLGAGLTSLKQTRFANGTFPVGPARRMGNYFSSLANGTIIENTTILAGIVYPETKYLRYAQPETTLTGTAVGATALLRDTEFNHTALKLLTALPEPTALSHAIKYAATYLFSVNPSLACDALWDTSEFSPLPSGIHVVESVRPDRRDCMVVAKLQVSAGVTHCNQTDPMLEPTCILDSNIIVSASREVRPDPLTDMLLAMMPEVHTTVASLRMFDTTQHKGNLSRVLRESLVQTYQAAWSAMSEVMSQSIPPEQKPQTRAWEPEQFLEARVSA